MEGVLPKTLHCKHKVENRASVIVCFSPLKLSKHVHKVQHGSAEPIRGHEEGERHARFHYVTSQACQQVAASHRKTGWMRARSTVNNK